MIGLADHELERLLRPVKPGIAGWVGGSNDFAVAQHR